MRRALLVPPISPPFRSPPLPELSAFQAVLPRIFRFVKLMSVAPQGTVSFLFTDIVGSTRLWDRFPQFMGAYLARHDALLHEAAAVRDGYVFKTVGDAFCMAFSTPLQALQAAIAAQHALAAEDWGEIGSLTVRMGIHTGAAEFRDNDYFGATLNRVARIESAAHGGQILLSQISMELLEDEGLDGISFKSLGSHRLRNLDRPEHLFQVVVDGLKESFPPPKSMEVLPNNLPAQTTSFIGRAREMEEIQAALRRSNLVTLTGTGGTGKTRTSLEIGARLINEFPAGVWLIELAPVSEASRIVDAVASVLGVREEPGQSLRDTLLDFLRGKTILLILDNCEHLVPALSSLVSDILRHCPRVKILATSRHSLAVVGETTYTIPPLGIFDVRLQTLAGPDIAVRLSQFDAVKLFIERATAVRSDFKVTNENAPALAEICSRLDGIPLAIELAAARVRVLDLDQIAARLNDRFRLLRSSAPTHLPHQQTLQALIDWSYDLLSETERILFRRLGVFVVGRTLDALEHVCSGDGIEQFDILDLTQQLVDKSLVMVERDAEGDPRFTVTESVWHYSREKLEASGEGDTIRNRHLDYYLAWAEKHGPRLEGPDQKIWLDRAQNEFFNFRAAVDWAGRSGRIEEGIRIIYHLYRLVEVRGNVGEALEMLDGLLHREVSLPPAVRAEAAIAAGRLAWTLDHYTDARRHLNEARSISESIHDEANVGLADMLIGFLDRGDERPEEAEKCFLNGLEIGRRLNQVYLLAGCQSGLGSLALDRGDLVESRRLKEESLIHYQKLGDHWVTGLILWGIARVALAQHDVARARTVLAQWVAIARELGNGWILPYILDCYSELALISSDATASARYFGVAQALREHYNTRFAPREQAEHDALLARLKAALSPEDFAAAVESGRQASAWDVLLSSDKKP